MKLIFFYILICSFLNCRAQTYKALTHELYTFSIKTNVLTKDTLGISENPAIKFVIKELVKPDSILSYQYGIYQFESTTEDLGKNIFFKRNDMFEIYDISNFGFFMPRFIDFINEPSFVLTDEIKLKYIEAIIEIYKERSEFKTDVIIEENHDKFKFFIDSDNYIK